MDRKQAKNAYIPVQTTARSSGSCSPAWTANTLKNASDRLSTPLYKKKNGRKLLGVEKWRQDHYKTMNDASHQPGFVFDLLDFFHKRKETDTKIAGIKSLFLYRPFL